MLRDGLGFKSPAHFANAPQTHDSAWHHYALVLGKGGNYSYSNFRFYIDGQKYQILVGTTGEVGLTQCLINL